MYIVNNVGVGICNTIYVITKNSQFHFLGVWIWIVRQECQILSISYYANNILKSNTNIKKYYAGIMLQIAN